MLHMRGSTSYSTSTTEVGCIILSVYTLPQVAEGSLGQKECLVEWLQIYVEDERHMVFSDMALASF